MNNKTHIIRICFLLMFGFIGGGLCLVYYFYVMGNLSDNNPKETYLPEPYLTQKNTLILKCIETATSKPTNNYTTVADEDLDNVVRECRWAFENDFRKYEVEKPIQIGTQNEN